MSVKVGVRVRPFNQREVDLNCRLCVDMIGPMTRLFDADDPDKHRDYTFDYSFWSHDNFHPDENGYLRPDSPKYADQQQVFENVGLQILSNAWEGYHCCLFAYGQTGSGKSYSMVGYGANKGIVPISCEEIFNRIQKNQDKNKEYQVNVSMLEIYNERVQDLLIPISKRTKEGFKIRQHKTLGIYVEGLSKHYVDTYQSIQNKMMEGGKNRSIAATQMNASSSRAHTIISIQFRQKQTIEGKKREKLSVIHLVDLAGSEKVGKTGATGDRLKEAAGINKSLSVLGLVISTLADKALGKGKGIVVPYRDSCLTRILQNALGGNSKTLMICAISPATDNYDQTLSTLRYADQAKKIQNKAVVNESETDKIIRNLTAEKEQLKDKLQKYEEMFKKMSLDPGKMEEFNEAKQQLRYNNEMMKDYEMTKEEKLEQQNSQYQLSDINKIDITRPHLSNLNQDPQLSNMIKYSIDKELITIGKRKSEPRNDIEIGGMGIRAVHAHITQDQEENIFVQPITESDDSSCYLNGEYLTQKRQLKTCDRLTFGTNNMFVVVIPGGESRTDRDISEIDWDFAQNQLYLKKQILEKEEFEKKQKLIREENQEKLKMKEEELFLLQKKLEQQEEMRKNLEEQKQIERGQFEKKVREEQAQRLKEEIEKGKKHLQDRETQQKERIKEKYYFEKKLLKTLPKCIELNLIAKEFKRNISMSVKMLLPNDKEDDEEQDIDLKRRTIKIKVVNKQVGYSYWWDVDKLSNRYYIIKDMSETYFETGIIPELTEKDDPFWDPPEHVLIGRAFLTTKALSYMFDNLTTLSIIGEDDHCGEITVNMIPTDETGERNLCQEMDDEEIEFQPEELINKPFYYNVLIENAIIPDNYKNIYVEYGVKIDEKKSETFRTDQISEKTKNPTWNYKKLHSFKEITDILLNYLITAKIVFKIYAYQIVPEEKREKEKKNSEKEIKKEISSPPKNSSMVTQITEKPEKKEEKPYVISMKQPNSQIQSNPSRIPATVTNNQMKKKKKDKDDCRIF